MSIAVLGDCAGAACAPLCEISFLRELLVLRLRHGSEEMGKRRFYEQSLWGKKTVGTNCDIARKIIEEEISNIILDNSIIICIT